MVNFHLQATGKSILASNYENFSPHTLWKSWGPTTSVNTTRLYLPEFHLPNPRQDTQAFNLIFSILMPKGKVYHKRLRQQPGLLVNLPQKAQTATWFAGQSTTKGWDSNLVCWSIYHKRLRQQPGLLVNIPQEVETATWFAGQSTTRGWDSNLVCWSIYHKRLRQQPGLLVNIPQKVQTATWLLVNLPQKAQTATWLLVNPPQKAWLIKIALLSSQETCAVLSVKP